MMSSFKPRGFYPQTDMQSLSPLGAQKRQLEQKAKHPKGQVTKEDWERKTFAGAFKPR